MSERDVAIGLVFDGGPSAGLGHQQRMRALGAAIASSGGAPELIEADGTPTSRDVLFVDSYRWRADDIALFNAPLVAAIDDIQRDLDVDLLVDCASSRREQGGASRNSLFGPQYSLIDPALLQLPRRPVTEIRSVLVTCGGSDTGSMGSRIADDLRRALPASVNVRLAVGPWSDAPTVSGVELLFRTNGLGPELAEADLVVTAAGVTMLESLSLGRPTIALVLHSNQRRQAEAAAQAHAAALCDIDNAVRVAAEVAADASMRHTLSENASIFADGRGAMRVAKALLDLADERLGPRLP